MGSAPQTRRVFLDKLPIGPARVLTDAFSGTAPSIHESIAVPSIVRSRRSWKAKARTTCADDSKSEAASIRHAEMSVAAEAGDEVTRLA